MAEPKKKKKVTASTAPKTKKEAAPVGNATGLRIGAVALWLVAIALEVVAYLLLIGKITLTFMPTLTLIIIALVLDLVCVIIGSQLWMKANHIKPASEKNKVLFWLWNNMGLIVSTIAFLPFVILALTNKDADKKTKTIATVVAAVALLIGGASSIDYNPVSEEQQQAAIEAINTHEDCQALNNSDALTYGTVEQAIAENRTRLCAFCAKKDDIQGVVTDDKE